MSNYNMNELKAALDMIDSLPEKYWIDTLEDRKKKEIEFFDKFRDSSQIEEMDKDTYDKIFGARKYYVATKPSKEYVNQWIAQEVQDKVVLDYCCGDAYHAITAARAGAKLAIGIDISSVSIDNARKLAEEAGVSKNTYFVQADAEQTKLPGNSIDIAICSGVLHHLNITKAFPELHRILTLGGKLLAIEALNYNPAIKLYRLMTPDMRTKWETSHILSLKDIKFARTFFDVGEIKYWHILAIMEPHFPYLAKMFHAIDNIITKIPLLKLMAWIFTFELIKRKA